MTSNDAGTLGMRVLSDAELLIVSGGELGSDTDSIGPSGGPSNVEQSLSNTFSKYNGIELNADWGLTTVGEYYLDSDNDSFYDTVYFEIEAGHWIESTDGGTRWTDCPKPNYYGEYNGSAKSGSK